MGAAGLPVGPLAARATFPYTTLACVLLIVGAATYVGVCQRGKHHLTHHRAASRAAAGGSPRCHLSSVALGCCPTGGGAQGASIYFARCSPLPPPAFKGGSRSHGLILPPNAGELAMCPAWTARAARSAAAAARSCPSQLETQVRWLMGGDDADPTAMEVS